jgi:hypothetical protein
MALNRTLHRAVRDCPLTADNAFGPVIVPSCRQGFDFTLMFEQSILSIAPTALLLLLIPLKSYWLCTSDVKISPYPSLFTGKAVRVSFPQIQRQEMTLLIDITLSAGNYASCWPAIGASDSVDPRICRSNSRIRAFSYTLLH